MATACQLSGKKQSSGHNVSHSQRKTKRTYKPNTFKKTIIDPFSGEKVTLRISAKAQKTLLKNPKKYKTQLAEIVRKKSKKQVSKR